MNSEEIKEIGQMFLMISKQNNESPGLNADEKDFIEECRDMMAESRELVTKAIPRFQKLENFHVKAESELKDLNIMFATAQGKIRKNDLNDFSSINASGKIAMKLDPNDKIIGVKICKDDQDIMLSTKNGKCIRFLSKKLRIFKGRSSKGIRGINLADKDSIVSLSIIDHDSNKKNGKLNKDDKSELKAKEKFILSITENGFGKRTSHYDFRVTNRGGKGIIGIVNSARNGNVSSSFLVYEGDQILISTNKGRAIRVAVKEIRVAGRNTQGVRIIKLSGDEKVVSAIKIDDNLL